MRLSSAGIVLLCGVGISVACAREVEVDADLKAIFESAVVKVRAVGATGSVNDGSAVVVAPDRLVTTCHTTRGAKAIEVVTAGGTWRAYPSYADVHQDLCVLFVPDLIQSTPAMVAGTNEAKLGDTVFAVGFPKGEALSVSSGLIKGLHRYNDGQVIQVSAPFDHGQSGGALFDLHGRLIGITAFKARAGGDFHFALPLEWLREEIKSVGASAPMPTGAAFWEKSRSEQPLFLQAASLEADGKWEALSYVAQRWVAAENRNPCSWLALGRALERLKRDRDAAIAFQRAAELALSPGTAR